MQSSTAGTESHQVPSTDHTSDHASSQDDIKYILSGQDGGNSNLERIEDRLSAFTLFPKLPAELRLKIWSHASRVTRNLVLQIGYIGVKDDGAGWQPYYFYSTCPLPAVLTTCRESRKEALQHYSLDFGVKETSRTWACPIAITFEAPATIYINWNFDRVCIFGPSGFEAIDWISDVQYTNRLQELGRKFRDRELRYLAIELENLDEHYSGYDKHHQDLLSLSENQQHLEELILFQQNQVMQYSYQRDGPLKFGVVSRMGKEKFNSVLVDICNNLRAIGYREVASKVPALPFDVRCANPLFLEQEETERDIMKSKDAGRGTLMASKGERREYVRWLPNLCV
ncbi:hypothetical protein ACEPPN_005028 [Leptodophora sp. 'Broadleaf-Isolate-01']